MSTNRETLIADMPMKLEIEDENLIIVEDNEDTKRSNIAELKKSFSGDYKEPSDRLFYSSQKIEEYIDELERMMSTFADAEDFNKLKTRVESIIASAGSGKDSELVDARDGENTLSARLDRDNIFNEDKFLSQYRRTIQGKEISTGLHGYINLYLDMMTGNTANIIFKSKNILNIKDNTDTAVAKYTDTGFRYSPGTPLGKSERYDLTEEEVTINLNFPTSLPKGKYFFFANIIYDNIFKDKGNIRFAVKNTNDDSAYTEFTYNQTGKFEFIAPKAFNQIKIMYNQEKEIWVANSVVEYKNIMLMHTDKYSDSYIPYHNSSVSINKNSYIKGYNANYDITCSDDEAIIIAEYYDHSITTNTIYDDVDDLKNTLIRNRDKCGLITNYGESLFFDNAICETPTSCRLSLDNDKFKRNGNPSLKVTFAEDVKVNPIFAIELNNPIEVIESVSLVFYIDRTDSYFFTTNEPIIISLCSDSYKEPEMVNYAQTVLRKDELVQGWNIIKRGIGEFATNGRPNIHGIKYAKVEIVKNDGLDNRSIYINSIIFNQKMKPTVLLAFDGIYEEGIDYAYPYLTTRKVPATIMSNNRTTFGKTILDKIVELRCKYGWDLGQYGCNPNKELLTHDDNPREQYLALKTAKEWLRDNLVFNPIAYSAPYGNLRPLTVPLLKDMGYKIAKTDSTGYCNFFDPEYDFAIPMTLMSNVTTADEIKDKIQYAIDNNSCICIYTNNVTEYGDEISAKKMLLEEVVKFILDNSDKITPMTFSEFYNKCNK